LANCFELNNLVMIRHHQIPFGVDSGF